MTAFHLLSAYTVHTQNEQVTCSWTHQHAPLISLILTSHSSQELFVSPGDIQIHSVFHHPAIRHWKYFGILTLPFVTWPFVWVTSRCCKILMVFGSLKLNLPLLVVFASLDGSDFSHSLGSWPNTMLPDYKYYLYFWGFPPYTSFRVTVYFCFSCGSQGLSPGVDPIKRIDFESHWMYWHLLAVL